MIMTDNMTCCVCGKPAIGMQFLGCCASAVCEDHAERFLLALVPGETMKSGTCTFVRYPDKN
ncbi:hypothetical protein KHC33_13330 [Methanospirillum sp. J.3.6.1-F.2.7.3]|uniref:Uncharacterized protein n=2 Tax=Methanospirillum purgamenti TaxID=2834276 RepID=A0A8E7AZX2_9EURY|nr:hypothetical protein KHC33_13330 [Methanospirillum sp. J.3.6.1-F.2.7.3]